MNLLLNLKFYLGFIIAGNAVVALMIGAYLLRHRYEETLRTFFQGRCLQTAAWIIVFFNGGALDRVTAAFGNTLLFAGCAMEACALLQLTCTYTLRLRHYYQWMTAASIVSFHLILFTRNDLNLRVAFAATCLGVLLLLPVFRMLLGAGNSLLMRLIGFLYLVIIVSHFVRSVSIMLLHHTIDHSLFSGSLVTSLAYLTLNLSLILGGTGFVLLLKEVTDEKLLNLANHDDLTGALNRRAFFERTQSAIYRYARKQQPISLLLFDVDRFKSINDTFGHDVGDRVLRSLSRHILGRLNEHHLFARFGGDEFAILMPGYDEQQSEQESERIRAEIAASTIHLPDQSLMYTISIGLVTLIPDAYTDSERLYISCDNALYGAKRNGKNRACRGQYLKEL
ncbi:GGDEF domain-containing protein [Sporolactobacillus terrae]|uniref:GGDEF domain-containing protein n=1 Tax=Sporolactobacillus terrae TaxID=269673 RepID=UPI00048AAB69|nr:GGDEF domain-containing protein [Sporolactobacillus terrae]